MSGSRRSPGSRSKRPKRTASAKAPSRTKVRPSAPQRKPSAQKRAAALAFAKRSAAALRGAETRRRNAALREREARALFEKRSKASVKGWETRKWRRREAGEAEFAMMTRAVLEVKREQLVNNHPKWREHLAFGLSLHRPMNVIRDAWFSPKIRNRGR